MTRRLRIAWRKSTSVSGRAGSGGCAYCVASGARLRFRILGRHLLAKFAAHAT